jgi:hypothetical protein
MPRIVTGPRIPTHEKHSHLVSRVDLYKLALLCLLVVSAACGGPATAPVVPEIDLKRQLERCPSNGQPIALIGGTLIDGTGAEPLHDAALIVRDRCITAVGPRDQIPLPADAKVIELDGATLLPGLIDAHVHNAYDERLLRAPSHLRKPQPSSRSHTSGASR